MWHVTKKLVMHLFASLSHFIIHYLLKVSNNPDPYLSSVINNQLILIYPSTSRTKGGHSSKRHHHGVRGQAHHQSQSGSPGRHRHTSGSGRKKSESRGRGSFGVRQRSSSWSSGRSSSRSGSRERDPSKAKSPHPHARQNNSR